MSATSHNLKCTWRSHGCIRHVDISISRARIGDAIRWEGILICIVAAASGSVCRRVSHKYKPTRSFNHELGSIRTRVSIHE